MIIEELFLFNQQRVPFVVETGSCDVDGTVVDEMNVLVVGCVQVDEIVEILGRFVALRNVGGEDQILLKKLGEVHSLNREHSLTVPFRSVRAQDVPQIPIARDLSKPIRVPHVYFVDTLRKNLFEEVVVEHEIVVRLQSRFVRAVQQRCVPLGFVRQQIELLRRLFRSTRRFGHPLDRSIYHVSARHFVREHHPVEIQKHMASAFVIEMAYRTHNSTVPYDLIHK